MVKLRKVIVFMGDVVVFGGYYIVMGVLMIFVERMIIIGFIGVFGVILFIGDVLNSYFGVFFDCVQINSYVIFSFNWKLSLEEILVIQQEVDQIYMQFKDCVVVGWGMIVVQVEKIVCGRVWIGVDVF